jgi:hypothetical protein
LSHAAYSRATCPTAASSAEGSSVGVPSPAAPFQAVLSSVFGLRPAVAAVALVLVLVLAGCSAEKPPVAAPPAAVTAAPTVVASPSTGAVTAVPTKTATRAPAATTTAPAPEAPPRLDRFVAAVQRQLPEVAVDRREEEVAAIGELACSARAAGKGKATVVAEIENAGVTEADARKLLTIAEDTACRT